MEKEEFITLSLMKAMAGAPYGLSAAEMQNALANKPQDTARGWSPSNKTLGTHLSPLFRNGLIASDIPPFTEEEYQAFGEEKIHKKFDPAKKGVSFSLTDQGRILLGLLERDYALDVERSGIYEQIAALIPLPDVGITNESPTAPRVWKK